MYITQISACYKRLHTISRNFDILKCALPTKRSQLKLPQVSALTVKDSSLRVSQLY
jgi:hypothetical protein